MKKFLGILVLGLLWCSNAYADTVTHCSVAADDTDASASSSSSKLDRIYQCADNNTFILDEGEYIGGGDPARIDMGTATNVTIDNSGTIHAEGSGSVITSGASGVSGTIKVTNRKSTGLIKGDANGIYVGAGDNWEIDNYGDIYGVDAKAINVRGGDNNKITNRSGAKIRTDGDNAILAWESSDGTDVVETITIDNYGTISANKNSILIMENSTGVTITNYSGGIVESSSGNVAKGAIRIEADDTTIINKGSLNASGNGSSIRLHTGITGTKIYVDEAASFTGQIHLGNSNAAEATTLYLECNISQDTTIEIHTKPGLDIVNNLCGNDTYTIQDSSQNPDADNSETDGFLVIDEGLEVVSYNAKYRSENVSTKLKGLFNAANYINAVGPEDKFFRIFYSNVKRENMYKGSMAGVVGQLSSINWGSITSNIFLGYSNHDGDFDNGEFLGGGNYALGLKNVFTKNGMKISFSPMIGLNDLDVTDYDSDSGAKIKTNLLSEFLAINGKIDKEIKTSEEGSLNLSVQSTLGMQRFSDYISKFSDGDLSVDESIEQILSGGFEVKYNEEIGKGFVISPYVGVSLNRNLNNNIDIVADDDKTSTSPAYSVTSGYYAGLNINKEDKDINFGLDLMYGNEEGLINQIAAVSLTKSFGKAKKETAIIKKPASNLPKIDESLTAQDYNKSFKELEMLRDLNEKIKVENTKLKAQNEKLKLLAQKTLEENEVSKKLIVELLKENEKVKIENQIFKNRILENENKELIEQLEGSNAGNKPSRIFLLIFGITFALGVLGSTKLITLSTASIYNRIMYRPVKA
jgi:hypothetical protein